MTCTGTPGTTGYVCTATNATTLTCNTGCFSLNLAASVRISGFTMTGGGGERLNCNVGAQNVNKHFRVDHNRARLDGWVGADCCFGDNNAVHPQGSGTITGSRTSPCTPTAPTGSGTTRRATFSISCGRRTPASGHPTARSTTKRIMSPAAARTSTTATTGAASSRGSTRSPTRAPGRSRSMGCRARTVAASALRFTTIMSVDRVGSPRCAAEAAWSSPIPPARISASI